MMIHLLHAAFVYQAPDGEVEALRDVSLDVEEGEFCSIVGPSGCGKSTLLSALAGLEPLTGGEIAFPRRDRRGRRDRPGPVAPGGLHAPAGSAVPLAEHLGQCDPGAGRPGGEHAGEPAAGPGSAGPVRPGGLWE